MFLALARQISLDLWSQGHTPPAPTDPDSAWLTENLWKDAVNRVFRYRPIDLQQYMEQFWAAAPPPGDDYYFWPVADARRAMAEPVRIGKPAKVAPGVADGYSRPAVPGLDGVNEGEPRVPDRPTWKHLIYSYMIENTRIVEVFRKVLHEIFHGEALGRANAEVMNWAHLTERLVFSDRDGHWLNPPISEIRPDPVAIRRNAYYRLFGMDLSHGLPDGRPYPYFKPEMANREFVPTFEALLREVWRAYTNRENKSGVNTTDEAGMADLCKRLENMLQVRRIYGALSQHEFHSDAVMSWFHLTVSANNSVITWLQADAHDPALRLRAVAERVGVPAHTCSYELFEIAGILGEMVSRIEHGEFKKGDDTRVLYKGEDSDKNYTTSKMTSIINHWSKATGRNLKEYVSPGESMRRSMAALPATTVTVQPVRAPSPVLIGTGQR